MSEPGPPKKRKDVSVRFTKKKKVVLLLVVVAILALVLIWGFIPEKYYKVSEIAEDPEDFVGKDIQLTGKVANNSLDLTNRTFNLTDGKYNLTIISKNPLPETIREGKDVMLKGVLKRQEGGEEKGSKLENYFFEAREVKVGCPSNYY